MDSVPANASDEIRESGLTRIPLGLRHAIESGDCVLFVGAGIGKHARGPNGRTGPDADTLAKELAEYFSISTVDNYDLARIAEVVEHRKGRRTLEAFLKQRLLHLEPDPTLMWLFTLRWRAVFTTNYDAVIQRAYDMNPKPPQQPRTFSLTRDLVPIDPRFDVPIYHLHGTVFGSGDPAIVVTQSDYARFRERRRMLFELLKKECATATVLYVGYSNRDPNWRTVLEEIQSEFYPSKLPQSYRLSPDIGALDIEILKSIGIETITASLEEFATVASATLQENTTDIDPSGKVRASIPSDLTEAYKKNPPAVLRFLSSWTYVNQAPFNAPPNTRAFFRGDRANWALIAARQHFERDLEEELYEILLDYATDLSPSRTSLIVLGPAGYGMSTLLLSLAVRLVQDRAGPVFMHRPGAPFLEGDVEYASSLFPEARPFFLIDNAADWSAAISAAVDRLRNLSRPALFLLAERKNEWRQAHGRFHPRELELEPLSDAEIERLLDCLSRASELGVLEHLDRGQQIAAIKSKHRKELLVTLREATEDRGFDAILEDEFRGIADELSQRLYLMVCSFYQHEAYVRDSLLADLLGVSIEGLYSKTAAPTEGVVIYDCIDEARGRYGARARHRTIATVVWDRCGDHGEKEQILNAVLSQLNLNYGSDKEAFERFIRADRVIDSIRTLESKVRFFETACRKDPESPYVRQHYSRMLYREGKAELALGQIEEAIRLNPRARVMYHTKGLVLSLLAQTTESLDLARRRLAQSEQAYRQAISMYERDEYSYQGLATLYLAWAKRTGDTEATEYIQKCEEVISEGLRKAYVRDGLWIVSSEVEKFLGDEPSRIVALERAVQESPGSVIARYLLGRLYRQTNQAAKAIEVLEPVIRNHPDEFRACIEYARALLLLGETLPKAIAILRLGARFGFGDPRFIATLGGLLFLNQEHSEAERVFDESVRRAFPRAEANVIQFRAFEPGPTLRPLRIEGLVVAIKAGYAFLESGAYPPFFYPGTKVGGVPLTLGIRVSFEVAFCAKGAVADRLRIV